MIAQADAIRIPLPDQSIHCCVTSPPYWGLRKYSGNQGRIWGGDPECEHEWVEHIQPPKGGRNLPDNMPNTGGNKIQQLVDNPRFGVTTEFCQLCGAWYGSLGLEPTPEQHTENIVEICREVRRVLRDDGVLWLNYGDCYYNHRPGKGSGLTKQTLARNDRDQPTEYSARRANRQNIGEGSLMMMPHRVALALQADGWIVRQDLVWSKSNPMPESLAGTRWIKHRIKVGTDEGAGKQPTNVGSFTAQNGGKDVPKYIDCPGCEKCIPNDGLVLKRGSWRHTRSHEFIFMLVKKMQYFSNQEAVREDIKSESALRYEYSLEGSFTPGSEYQNEQREKPQNWKQGSGRNPRSVLDVPTAPYRGAHYATFPPNLIAPLIRATCPRRCCPVCGQGWAAVVDARTIGKTEPGGKGLDNVRRGDRNDGNTSMGKVQSSVLGYKPTCEHPHTQEEAVPGIVFDPFVGSGTTIAVAKSLLRRGVGIDISMEYLDEQAKVRAGLGTPSKALEDLPLFK